jgi:hypothetical protein
MDPIEQLIYLNMLSVAREYQNPKGEAIRKSCEFLKTFRDELERDRGISLKNKILATTRHPKACTRVGWQKSKRTIMEIEL